MPQIDPLLDVMLERRATDLHLRVGVPPLGRVKGELVVVREDPLQPAEMEPLLMEILNLEQRSRVLSDMDLDFAYAYGNKALFRASYFHTMTGLSAVFRRVPKKIPSVANLRLPEVLRTLAERRAGLVLLTGGARCGKSVTLAAMIQSINLTRPCHVVALEDPIEFVHEPHRAQITQREIGEHVASFLAGLAGVAHDDADVVAISEIRTHELLVRALELACAGVLVLGTLPTRGAVATLERILDDTPEGDRAHMRRLLANGLAAVVSQQLVDLADGKGKVAAVEVMVISSAAAAAIQAGKAVDLSALMLEPDSVGSQTMDMALEKLVQEGAITLETALDKAAAGRESIRTGAD